VNDQTTAMDPTGFLVFGGFGFVLGLLTLVAMWRVFNKAGRPGWAAIVPIYNAYTLLKVAGRPGWWLLLLFIPLVNVVVTIVVAIDVAKAFGRGGVFGVFGLWLFSFVGYPILGFGDSRYVGSADAAPAGV
jgi:hypothetical protein